MEWLNDRRNNIYFKTYSISVKFPFVPEAIKSNTCYIAVFIIEFNSF